MRPASGSAASRVVAHHPLGLVSSPLRLLRDIAISTRRYCRPAACAGCVAAHLLPLRCCNWCASQRAFEACMQVSAFKRKSTRHSPLGHWKLVETAPVTMQCNQGRNRMLHNTYPCCRNGTAKTHPLVLMPET